MADKLSIQIGIEHKELNGNTVISILLENISGEDLSLVSIPQLQINGCLNGWAPFDLLHTQARPLAGKQPIKLNLAPGQTLFSQVQPRALTYSDSSGSTYPNLSWRDFLKTASTVCSDIEIFVICDFTGQSDITNRIESNRISARLDRTDDTTLALLLDNIQLLVLLIKQLSSRLEGIGADVQDIKKKLSE